MSDEKYHPHKLGRPQIDMLKSQKLGLKLVVNDSSTRRRRYYHTYVCCIITIMLHICIHVCAQFVHLFFDNDICFSVRK